MDNANKMNDPWAARWNDRYRPEEFAYGTAPNNYLKDQLSKFTTGHILFAVEGYFRDVRISSAH